MMMAMPSRRSIFFMARTDLGNRRYEDAAPRRDIRAADGVIPKEHGLLSRKANRTVFLQQFVNGVTLGAVYTLIALSFSLVMGILGVLNLAIAELFMIGGYFGFAAVMAKLPLPVALLAGRGGGGPGGRGCGGSGYPPGRG